MSWRCMDAISLTQQSFALRRVNQAVNGEPVAFTAHGGFGEGDGETHLPEGRNVRPVPTLRSGGEGGDSLADHNLGRNICARE
jgi:hypothetical protein